MALDPSSYLAALIDGEGTIGAYKTKTGHSCRIAICSTDLDIIEAAQKCFSALEIPISISTTPYETKKLRYDLHVRGGYHSFKKVEALIPIQCVRKQLALKKILESRKWKVMPGKAWFEAQYHGSGKSIFEISQQLNCAPMTVYNWLRRYSIPRRSLSLAAKQDWEKRGHRRR